MRYNVTDINDNVDQEIYKWLLEHIPEDQYTIHDEGFLIEAYYLRFTNKEAETMFKLRWS